MVKLLLGPSYGIVIKEIVDEIQQDNIGLYNDVEYLLSLTATMRALLYSIRRPMKFLHLIMTLPPIIRLT